MINRDKRVARMDLIIDKDGLCTGGHAKQSSAFTRMLKMSGSFINLRDRTYKITYESQILFLVGRDSVTLRAVTLVATVIKTCLTLLSRIMQKSIYS
jgi:hypothetical protein